MHVRAIFAECTLLLWRFNGGLNMPRDNARYSSHHKGSVWPQDKQNVRKHGDYHERVNITFVALEYLLRNSRYPSRYKIQWATGEGHCHASTGAPNIAHGHDTRTATTLCCLCQPLKCKKAQQAE